MKRELSKFEFNKNYGLVSLLLMVVLGFVVTNIEGGLFKEGKIFELLGGQSRNVFLFEFMKFLDKVGSEYFLVPFVLYCAFYSIKNTKKELLFGIICSSLGVFIFNALLKLFFQRPRPEFYMLVEEASSSYPSGHTMINTCLYLYLAYFVSNFITPKNKEKIYSLAIFGFLLMGFSRIYLGVHYPSDIIGGVLGGYSFFVFSVILTEKIRTNWKITYSII